jgi:hypothetical protein
LKGFGLEGFEEFEELGEFAFKGSMLRVQRFKATRSRVQVSFLAVMVLSIKFQFLKRTEVKLSMGSEFTFFTGGFEFGQN